MAAFKAATALGVNDKPVAPPGKTAAIGPPPIGPQNQEPAFNIGALAIPHVGADNLTFVDEQQGAATPVAHKARKANETTVGFDWFDKVHLTPRSKIDFGNIITTVTDVFELFSAFRSGDVTLTSFVNNAGPGVDVPDLPAPPTVLAPFTSFLDPSSVPLGPVKINVQATIEGPASFDDTLDFTFDRGAGTLLLAVKGERIVLVFMEPSGKMIETLEWKTDIITKKSGKEQRIADRKQPRQLFEIGYFLTDTERQDMQAILFDWQSRDFALPVRTEEMALTVAVVGGAGDTITVDSTDNVDLRVGSFATVFTDRLTNDVLTVQSKTSTTITFTSNVTNSYPVGTTVYPVRLAHAERVIQGRRHPVNVEELTINYRVLDNDTGVPTGDTTPFNSFNSKVLLDDCNFVGGTTSPERYEREILVINNETGEVFQTSPWEKNKRISRKGFIVKTRADLHEVRRLIYALRGRQISFYIPTFIEDLTVTQALGVGDDKIVVTNIGYVRFIRNRQQKASFKITFTDGTSLLRTITASTELSPTEERLTVDATWPAGRPVNEISRVEFLEQVRIDTDAIQIQHDTIVGHARIFFPVRVVFD